MFFMSLDRSADTLETFALDRALDRSADTLETFALDRALDRKCPKI